MAVRKTQPRRHRDATHWKCPKCGAKLISRNLSHACGSYSVDAFLEGAPEDGRALYLRFVALIDRCGPYTVAPAKTRVAFMVDVRFASVNRVGNGFIDVHFVLPSTIKSPRIRRIETVGPLSVHHLRLTNPTDCDAELAGWLHQSYREYGERRWLNAKRVRAAHSR